MAEKKIRVRRKRYHYKLKRGKWKKPGIKPKEHGSLHVKDEIQIEFDNKAGEFVFVGIPDNKFVEISIDFITNNFSQLIASFKSTNRALQHAIFEVPVEMVCCSNDDEIDEKLVESTKNLYSDERIVYKDYLSDSPSALTVFRFNNPQDSLISLGRKLGFKGCFCVLKYVDR